MSVTVVVTAAVTVTADQPPGALTVAVAALAACAEAVVPVAVTSVAAEPSPGLTEALEAVAEPTVAGSARGEEIQTSGTVPVCAYPPTVARMLYGLLTDVTSGTGCGGGTGTAAAAADLSSRSSRRSSRRAARLRWEPMNFRPGRGGQDGSSSPQPHAQDTTIAGAGAGAAASAIADGGCTVTAGTGRWRARLARLAASVHAMHQDSRRPRTRFR